MANYVEPDETARDETSDLDLQCITKTRLFKYTENFTTKKWQFFG